MTCIVGIEQNGVVYLGGDSAGVGGMDITTRRDEKVFKNGEFVMGFTTSFRMGQILRYAFTPPDREQVSPIARTDDMAYLVVDFVDGIRAIYREKGYAGSETEDEEPAAKGGTFIFGFNGNLYKADTDFQIGKTFDGFTACGCGESYALGSLHSSAHIKDPLERLKLALDAASHFSAGVRGPYNFVSTKDDGYIKFPKTKKGTHSGGPG